MAWEYPGFLCQTDREECNIAVADPTGVERNRRQMEAMLNGLQSLIKIGYNKVEEIDKAKQTIIFCDSQIQLIGEDKAMSLSN